MVVYIEASNSQKRQLYNCLIPLERDLHRLKSLRLPGILNGAITVSRYPQPPQVSSVLLNDRLKRFDQEGRVR